MGSSGERRHSYSEAGIEQAADFLQKSVEELIEGEVGSFSDFSQADMDEFKAIGENNGVVAINYINFRLKGGASLSDLSSFYELVVRQGRSIEWWLASSGAK